MTAPVAVAAARTAGAGTAGRAAASRAATGATGGRHAATAGRTGAAQGGRGARHAATGQAGRDARQVAGGRGGGDLATGFLLGGGRRGGAAGGAARTGAQRLLIAEFLVCIIVLALSPVARTDGDVNPRQWMKSGTAMCAMFIVLGMVSGIGPRSARVAAAIGGLVALVLLVDQRSIFGVITNRLQAKESMPGAGSPDGTLPDGTGSIVDSFGSGPGSATPNIPGGPFGGVGPGLGPFPGGPFAPEQGFIRSLPGRTGTGVGNAAAGFLAGFR